MQSELKHKALIGHLLMSAALKKRKLFGRCQKLDVNGGQRLFFFFLYGLANCCELFQQLPQMGMGMVRKSSVGTGVDYGHLSQELCTKCYNAGDLLLLDCDVSQTAIEGVMSQREQPIAFSSGVLLKTGTKHT